MKKWIYLAIMLSVSVLLSACGDKQDNDSANEQKNDNAEDTFTIGVIPAQTEGEMQEAMDKLQSILDEAMEKNVKVDVYPDYNGVVEAMNYDKIDMAYFGPLTYVVAHEKSGAKAIITQLIDGEPYYHSYIITHNDNPWESLEELLADPEEIDFAFGDPNSTSGALIPEIELQDQGVYQSEDEHSFNSVRFTGSHDATALAVQNKQVDAGAIDSAIYNQLVESGKVDGDQIKTIWQSEELFQYPWAVHQDTDEETIATLQETFQEIEDEEILNAFGATGFTTATNEDYESIRDAAIKQGVIEE
ncbi:phosphate/phosphite/phosphonate ABC transporter substrate-binding protein [Sediminibacillus dalangtanensis]|uniref:Phosphate/phosphite/phosphonate ABC transporter substrate-binding protein n=1 Tax=Sediminibacillus dalangtanensis TaxID=2729421 RepID=A0ABX7VQN6_9BACI|nr:phosphate/phosphite/phosphonate ABC transporter substrate-binding protein [Sediminibacillus dalangtanensis]QTM99179.1 phosphate/phosphite/phosphonate ABC transporter substrate-binding protein [Sediminibacillus dalangtanensis]